MKREALAWIAALGLGAVVLSKQALSQFGFLYDLGINNMATF